MTTARPLPTDGEALRAVAIDHHFDKIPLARIPQNCLIAKLEWNRYGIPVAGLKGLAMIQKTNPKSKPKLDHSDRLCLTALSDTHYASALLAQTPRRYWASVCWHPLAKSAGTPQTIQGRSPRGCLCWHPPTGKPAGRVFSAKSAHAGGSHDCH